MRRFVFLIGLMTTLVGGFTVMYAAKTYALSGSNWQAGNIIDDAVFSNSTSMSVNDIQNFLNQQDPNCDTWGTQPATEWGAPSMTHAQYAASRGWPAPPYVCLKEYYEVPKTSPAAGTPDNSYNHYDAGSKTLLPVPGGVSAAQLIYNAAQQYKISPKVLLVKIQTESSGPLTQDTWPLQSQYTYAMGAHCPDSGPGGSAQCDPNYAGFSIQISEAAALLRYYLDNMQQPWWTYKVPFATNSILWNVSASQCGGSDVYISTKGTAALYTYTPYQPNSAALAKVSNSSSGGTGDGCSAYGNRNFWWWFNTWFGSSHTDIPYAWNLTGSTAYVDANMTRPYTIGKISLQPGSKAYVQVQARNNGYQSWDPSVIKLGTTAPQDRASIFADNSWASSNRILMSSASPVAPGDTATYKFSFTAPSQIGTYSECFSLVAEYITWMNNQNLCYTIDVTQPRTIASNIPSQLQPGQSLSAGQYLMSIDGHSTFAMQTDGNLVEYTNFLPVWSDNDSGSGGNQLIMQTDGNLVEYAANGKAIWASNTNGNPNAYLALQTDGNAVIYQPNGTPLWASGKTTTPLGSNYVLYTLGAGQPMLPGQQLLTADSTHILSMQTDGNLVIYNTQTGKALWASGTVGRPVAYAIMQTDGNLVLYASNGKALWASGTDGQGISTLSMQTDGNLVIYNSATGKPTWASGTDGR